MNLTSYSVTACLVIFLVFGTLDVFFGLHFRARSQGPAYARKLLWRGCAWVMLSLSFLALFRGGILGTWTVLTTVGVLVLLNEYLLIWIDKGSSTQDTTQVVPTLETWSVTRAHGKTRFVLISIAVYGFGLLWIGILTKIILLEWFPLYLVPGLMVGGAVWGYFNGAGEWRQNEDQYLKLRDAGDDGT